jgi:hypothetical protein
VLKVEYNYTPYQLHTTGITARITNIIGTGIAARITNTIGTGIAARITNI